MSPRGILNSQRPAPSTIVAIAAVTGANRVTLPMGVANVVRWLRDRPESLSCQISWLGFAPGLRISDRETREPAAGVLSRVAASAWELPLEKKGNTFRFTIPETVRRIGLLPEYNKESTTHVVIYASDADLEVWRPEDWKNYLLSQCSCYDAQSTSSPESGSTSRP